QQLRCTLDTRLVEIRDGGCRRTWPPSPPRGPGLTQDVSRAQHGAPGAGEEPGLDEQRERVALDDRLPVEALDRQPACAACAHVLNEGCQRRPEPRLVGIA